MNVEHSTKKVKQIETKAKRRVKNGVEVKNWN